VLCTLWNAVFGSWHPGQATGGGGAPRLIRLWLIWHGRHGVGLLCGIVWTPPDVGPWSGALGTQALIPIPSWLT
jgi:hypothetical protein